MEKEEKIAERERLAEEMSFFGRLREYYPAFAVFYVSVMRTLVWFLAGIKMPASTYIFPTQCLTIMNVPVTVVVTFVTQTLLGNWIERGQLWPIPHETLVFYIVFCGILAALSVGLKSALKKQNEEKDPVF